MHCSVSQCVAVCCSVLQCVAERCSVLQCVAVRCSVLQRVAACRSILRLHTAQVQCLFCSFFIQTHTHARTHTHTHTCRSQPLKIAAYELLSEKRGRNRTLVGDTPKERAK